GRTRIRLFAFARTATGKLPRNTPARKAARSGVWLTFRCPFGSLRRWRRPGFKPEIGSEVWKEAAMRRPGPTLLELLIVVIIIGAPLALLPPSARFPREAARRSQCSNNLKQLVLGLQNYHDTFGSLPYGARGRGADGKAGGMGP